MRQERNFSAVTAWVACGRTELPGRAGAGSVAQPSVNSAQQLSLCVHNARGSVLGRAGHSLENERPSPPRAQDFSPLTGTTSYCWACGFGLEPSLDKDTHASSNEVFMAWVPPHTFLCPFPFPGLCSLLLPGVPLLPQHLAFTVPTQLPKATPSAHKLHLQPCQQRPHFLRETELTKLVRRKQYSS